MVGIRAVVAGLSTALGQVKQLSGLLPIHVSRTIQGGETRGPGGMREARNPGQHWLGRKDSLRITLRVTLRPQGWLRTGLRLRRTAWNSPPGCSRLALPARHP